MHAARLQDSVSSHRLSHKRAHLTCGATQRENFTRFPHEAPPPPAGNCLGEWQTARAVYSWQRAHLCCRVQTAAAAVASNPTRCPWIPQNCIGRPLTTMRAPVVLALLAMVGAAAAAGRDLLGQGALRPEPKPHLGTFTSLFGFNVCVSATHAIAAAQRRQTASSDCCTTQQAGQASPPSSSSSPALHPPPPPFLTPSRRRPARPRHPDLHQPPQQV